MHPVRIGARHLKEYRQILTWCQENCSGEWQYPTGYASPSIWYFRKADDAALFTLVWRNI